MQLRVALDDRRFSYVAEPDLELEWEAQKPVRTPRIVRRLWLPAAAIILYAVGRVLGFELIRLDTDLAPSYAANDIWLATTKVGQLNESDVVCVRSGQTTHWKRVAFTEGGAYPEYFARGSWHAAPVADILLTEAYDRQRPIRWVMVPEGCVFVDVDDNDPTESGVVKIQSVVAKLIWPEPGPRRPVAPRPNDWGPWVTTPISEADLRKFR